MEISYFDMGVDGDDDIFTFGEEGGVSDEELTILSGQSEIWEESLMDKSNYDIKDNRSIEEDANSTSEFSLEFSQGFSSDVSQLTFFNWSFTSLPSMGESCTNAEWKRVIPKSIPPNRSSDSWKSAVPQSIPPKRSSDSIIGAFQHHPHVFLHSDQIIEWTKVKTSPITPPPRKRSRKRLSTHNKRKSSAEPLSLPSQSQRRPIDTSSHHNNLSSKIPQEKVVEGIPLPHSASPNTSPVNKRQDHEWKIVSPRAVACEQVVSPLHTDSKLDAKNSPSAVKRIKNAENLEKLNCRMNSAIGIHMSPSGATPSKNKNSKSLKQKRLQAEATRERLRKQFESVIIH